MELSDFKKDSSLAEYSYFKIGGLAAYLTIVENEVEFNSAIEVIRNNNLNYIVLENHGSFIVSDAGINDVAIIKNYNLLKQTNNLFKDVVCDKLMIDALKKKGVNLPPEFDVDQLLKANILIKECGLTGKCIGNACLNESTFSFESKNNSAKVDEFIQLVSYIKQQVRDAFSIQLEENFDYIGF